MEGGEGQKYKEGGLALRKGIEAMGRPVRNNLDVIRAL